MTKPIPIKGGRTFGSAEILEALTDYMRKIGDLKDTEEISLGMRRMIRVRVTDKKPGPEVKGEVK